MDIYEAQAIARQIRVIPNVQVLGVKTINGEKALIISIDRRGQKAIREADRAVARVAVAANIKGHWWEKLNLCSLCKYELKGTDGHYHSIIARSGATEAVCCNCVRKSGTVCSIRAAAIRERKKLHRESRVTAEHKAKRTR